MNPHLTEETELEELVALVKKDLEMIFTMTKLRDMSFKMKQASGQLPSDFYLLLKDAALNCDLP